MKERSLAALRALLASRRREVICGRRVFFLDSLSGRRSLRQPRNRKPDNGRGEVAKVLPTSGRTLWGTYQDGRVVPDDAVDWVDGARVLISPVEAECEERRIRGHVIVVGFGLAGRCVADLLDHAGIPYTIIEKNPVTVETQRALGRRAVQGDAADANTLIEAGLSEASTLALTIPDEEAVLAATSLVRRLRPEIYIIARTNYASKGMQAAQLGADEVIKAEQAVALQFYDRLSRRLGPAMQAAG